jgi:hypothetical protein
MFILKCSKLVNYSFSGGLVGQLFEHNYTVSYLSSARQRKTNRRRRCKFEIYA